MTTLVEKVSEEESLISKDANDNLRIHQCRNVLHPKERKVRPKCNKVLKRKLKKYKLRQDGQEDKDILDVSGILESSLTFDTPSEELRGADLELEQLRPTNYLFKMGRRKQTIIVTAKSMNSKTQITMVNGDGFVQLSPTSEEKKQTDAFKLLMDSRNKSIGCNSPGKEKPIDESETQELIEKKNNKAKRNLLLQKLAETKGSLKNKETEENQAKYVNKKMEKRAERLKNMISNIELKSSKDEINATKLLNGRSPLNSLKTEKNNKLSDKPVKTLQLVNMFDAEQKMSPEKKLISKEDSDFLNKLSPSLRKKESMLSYFKKVEKDQDCPLDNENDSNIIKVKLGTKAKKKCKKKKLSLNKGNSMLDIPTSEFEKVKPDITNQNGEFSNTNLEMAEEISGKERRKRKRDIKIHTFCDDAAVSSTNILASNDDGRSRRNAKRPVKYNEDAGLLSSDEELHIFTPKKKKHSDSKHNHTKPIIVDLCSNEENEDSSVPSKKAEKNAKTNKSTTKTNGTVKKKNEHKSIKLAPIFAAKSLPDPAAVEAKQKFLQSGVPEKLKKIMLKQVDKNVVNNCFLKVVHIQQLDGVDQPTVQLSLQEEISLDNHKENQRCQDLTFKTLLNMSTSQEAFRLPPKQIIPQIVLQNLKEKHPKYPVFRTYRLLRGKKKGDYKVGNNYLDLDNSVEVLNASIDNQNENPEQLGWSDKYKPLASSQIIGNFESVKELKKWLVSWTEHDMKSKVTNGNGSDSSDFYQSEDDSKDSVKSSNNLLVLSGPVGSGKTSSVYAIAAELSIKVIEVNASSKRTGKIMLQDLQEATQSHKVNRQASSNENSQISLKSEVAEPIPVVIKVIKKRGRPKKNAENVAPKKIVLKKSLYKEKSECTNGISASQEVSRTCMSLILIDDADIVFDQDDGFCSAIVQLVHSSKRPVILITSTLSCPHLQRFIQSSKLLKMNPLLPNILGTWLDIMCLADSGMCWPGVGSKVLNFFKGDVRKAINCLQFYVCSEEQTISQDIESCSQSTDCRVNIDDETSNMSWVDHAGEYKNDEPVELNDPSKSFMLQEIEYKYPNMLFNIWWNLPKLLNVMDANLTKNRDENGADSINKSTKSLESISRVLDSLSLCDFYSTNCIKNKGNLTSDPWYSQESHSVSELENFDNYDRHYGTSDDIAHELALSSISIAQTEFGCKRMTDLDVPGMSQQRQRDRIVSRHNNLTGYLSPQAILDRKALALDYWSTCRTICRIEKSKTDTNSKRNNRFCHYLKSLSVLCKNDSFDKLANSLRSSEKHNVTGLL